MDSSTITLWTCLFPITWCLVSFYHYHICFTEIPVVSANSVDLDQIPRPVASDLGLHCLPITLLGVSQQKWFWRTTRPNIYSLYIQLNTCFILAAPCENVSLGICR